MDFHEHPARPIPTYEASQKMDKACLNAIFPVGSRWHYGPNRENMESIYEVIAEGAYQGLRDSWFIRCRVVSSPFYATGYVTGLPPHTLIPRAVVMEERGIVEDEPSIAELREEITRLTRQVEQLDRDCGKWKGNYERAAKTLTAVRIAVGR